MSFGFKPFFNGLAESVVLWRPLSFSTARHVRALKRMASLHYEQRALNGWAPTLWRSFHFSVPGTPWKLVLHDQGRGARTWVVFINTAKRHSGVGRYASFEAWLPQLPEPLQHEFLAQADLFPSAITSQSNAGEQTA